MIQRLADGFTLMYTDPSGQQLTVGYMDPDYLRVLGISEQQQQASHDNNAAVAGYTSALTNYQGWLNNDRQGAVQAAPSKPLKVIVDDMGNTTRIPFTPALPDPVEPTFVRSSGSIKATTAPPDRTDLLLMLASAIKSDSDAMKADIAAIKGKLGA